MDTSPYDGSLWARFCDELKRMGDLVLEPQSPKDDFNRAEGYRFLTRLLRDGLMRNLEFFDPQFPVLYDINSAFVSIGGNPDNDYLLAFIDGKFDYRLTGNRNSVHYLGIATKAGGFEVDGTLAPGGFLDSNQMKVAADGSFAITMSAKPPSPGAKNGDDDWLEMSEKSFFLIIRQTFLERSKEKAADFRIECLGGRQYPAPLDPAKFPDQLMGALKYIQGNIDVGIKWTREFQTLPNRFFPHDQSVYQQAGGDPTIWYAQGYWDLADDEALFVDVPKVGCDFWNFQINNYWQETLGLNLAFVHWNKATATCNADGSARLVIAHADPGLPNWMPTLGHKLGTMCFRFISAPDPISPTARLARRTASGWSIP